MTLSQGLRQITQKDFYSQNGEGLCLEYILHRLDVNIYGKTMLDIGAGDGFNLSNSKHLENIGWSIQRIEKNDGKILTVDNFKELCMPTTIVSIDIDGNDYWILKELFKWKPDVVVAEFNANFKDARTIKYNPNHVWDGTDYYGFSFDAGSKLGTENGYSVVHTTGNMNMFFVKNQLLQLDDIMNNDFFYFPNNFEKSNRTDWVWV